MWQTAQLMTMNAFVLAIIVLSGIYNKAPALIPVLTLFMMATVLAAVALFFARKKEPLRLAELIYLFLIFVSVTAVWSCQEYWAQLNQPFQAFIGYKILTVLFAIQAPSSRWVGWGSKLCLFAVPLLQYYLWTPNAQALIGPQEPWLTVVTVACASFIYHRRLKHMQITRNQARLEALSFTSHRFAHLLLGLQHLSNTPLQVIESSIQLLRDRPEEQTEMLLKIEKALTPLIQVSGVLSLDRLQLNWKDVRLPATVQEFETEIAELAKEIEHHQLSLTATAP
jgi:hypothetical protein